ncbi:fructose-specific PTS transporter subunit EIIC [Streptomyces lydicus]|uniref:fructose-specific PTS transporter subunit EIIC n=1 Tax=Streptomyces lydicus TaxID=47763 RepID=UPI0022C660BD|nr:fructose-specific PTS transporter subunit EIIC [Streptomyces lydicus]MCZ1009617.1 fructose-specific PTS transporter subunit EIIC [Streptomyces lydicus]
MTTTPADPPEDAGKSGQGLKLLAVTACPTGIAHTYMAAEKLAQTARSLGHEIKVETQGSIGAENVLSDNDVREADGIIIAADKEVDRSRFVGKRVLAVGVAEGIRHPERLIERVRNAPVYGSAEGDGAGARGGTGNRAGAGAAGGAAPGGGGAGGGRERGVAYKALMNGVSYMIPFVVVGGLLIAISLAVGGHPTPEGLKIAPGSFWEDVNHIGTIGFQLMVPVLSGYIAYAIGDRPALVPGMIGGWIATHGELYGMKDASAGFIGGIVTGFLAGYLVVWIKKVEVPKFARPIMPIIVIPIVATTVLGLFFIHVLGKPISWVFTHLTGWLSGMTGTSAIVLGAILGLMIAFDMGGPVNKTAFLFGSGLIASGNQTVMGMCAAAIPVMPLGQGLATLIRRRLYSEQERETGMAALFMGLFGISEGAIPFAAARPAQVIPANMLGGAVAGAVAGMAGVADAVPHGGPIVAVLGAVDGVPVFFVAVVIGTVVTALTTVMLVDVSGRRKDVMRAEEALGVRAAGGGAGVTAAGVGMVGGGTAGGARVGVDAVGTVAAGVVDVEATTAGVTAVGATTADVASAESAGAVPAGAVPDVESAAESVVVVGGGGAGSAAGAGGASRIAAAVADVPGTAAGAGQVAEGDAADGDAPGIGGDDEVSGDGAEGGTNGGRGRSDGDRSGSDDAAQVLSGHLTVRTVKTQLDADGKEAAIREMAELAAGTGRVADVDELVRVALAREAQGTTGLGEEIAIPHAKTDAVTAPVVAFARSADGIDWGAPDGTPARLVFMISVPEAAAGDEHLRILALLSRKLMDTEFRTRLQGAEDEAAILCVLGEIH